MFYNKIIAAYKMLTGLNIKIDTGSVDSYLPCDAVSLTRRVVWLKCSLKQPIAHESPLSEQVSTQHGNNHL